VLERKTENMKKGISTTLQRILNDTLEEISFDKSKESPKRVRRMISDAPPVNSFSKALSGGCAIIAEIKERSPSQGAMRHQNVQEAPREYRKSPFVKAVSVLTNRSNFGAKNGVKTIQDIRNRVSKPILRKDFILEEYQVYQARAYGADAILLMANILEKEEVKELSSLACDLGMDVLFETHRSQELDELPETANIIGINCRNFDSNGLQPNSFKVAKFLRQWLGIQKDNSVNVSRFEYLNDISNHALKVAESGVTANNCAEVFSMGFDAILVGTSLLMDKRGVAAALYDFEMAIKGSKIKSAIQASTFQPNSDLIPA
jgi:indole-3-glycerol phosphate synthase